MGVKMLNKLIRDKCEKSLYNIPLSKLRNKKIAVDVSIYMYRFLKKNELISSFYNMCSIFRKYNIHPIFVFDGKPPVEKNDTIKKRSTEKKFYRGKIEEYKQQIEELKKTDDETTNYKIEMLNEMIETLEPKTVVVKEYNIRDMKSFIRKYGMSYIDCVEEADVLCSKMCINGDVYAVLSEDMDIFVYGCPRVLRYFSLIHEECVMYDLSRILNQLNMNLFQFRILCILAGTDYKSTQDKYHLNIFKYFDYINNKKQQFWNDINKILYDESCEMYNFRNIYMLNPYIQNIIENKECILKQIDMYNVAHNEQHNYVIQNNKIYDLDVLKEFLQRHYIFLN